MASPPVKKASVSDSAWFWAATFVTIALVAALVAQPKYSRRQPQIERQFAARQIAGQIAAGAQGPVEPSTPSRMIVRLRPLHGMLAVGAIVAWTGLVLERRRLNRSRT